MVVSLENLAGAHRAKRAAALAHANALLDQVKRERVIKDHFQEGVMAALLLLTPDITREQFDLLMVEMAGAYAKRCAP